MPGLEQRGVDEALPQLDEHQKRLAAAKAAMRDREGPDSAHVCRDSYA
jgi:hypothetical protein